MKLEIEITEEEIRSAIERKVRLAIADTGNSYRADDLIKESVKRHWSNVVDALVLETLSNMPTLRARVVDAIERKLKAQLEKAMRAK